MGIYVIGISSEDAWWPFPRSGIVRHVGAGQLASCDSGISREDADEFNGQIVTVCVFDFGVECQLVKKVIVSSMYSIVVEEAQLEKHRTLRRRQRR